MSEILSQVRTILGEKESSEISDQTINGLYEQFKPFQTEENVNDIVNRVADGCRTFKGNLMNVMSGYASTHKTELDAIKAEKLRVQEELETLKKNPANPVPTKVEIPEELTLKISALDAKMIEIENREATYKKTKETDDRKARIADMVKLPVNGMPILAMVNMALSSMDFSKDDADTVYLDKIKACYNENVKGLFNGGSIPGNIVNLTNPTVTDEVEKLHREEVRKKTGTKFRT